MNDVLNSQGYTQAAWWNRIPVTAWVLLATIAIGCNLLIGYGAHRTNKLLFLVLPLAVSISFFLIADIDSPSASPHMPSGPCGPWTVMTSLSSSHPD